MAIDTFLHSVTEVRARLATRLVAPELPSGSAHKPAAVLIGLVDRPEGFTVLLTRRSEHLRHHPGQISFPGGGIEATDASPAMAALREAEEEVGLDPAQVEILGGLPGFATGTGFYILPLVALVTPPLALRPDPVEVAEIFELPLAFVLDPANRQLRTLTIDGVSRRFWTLTWGEHFIWGATAGMLVTLAQTLMTAPVVSS